MRIPSIELMQGWVLSKRDINFNQDRLRSLRSLEQGYLGEVAVDACFSWEWADRLIYLTDLCINFNGTCQIDAIGIGAGLVVVFEIKNYSGRYEYQNGQFYLNGREFNHNSLAQLARSVSIIQNLLRSMNIPVRVISRVVLANSAGEFFCDSEEISQKFLPIDRLKKFWKQFYSSEVGQPLGKKEFFASIICDHKVESLYTPQDIDLNSLKLGPICFRCKGMNFISFKYQLECGICHYKESKATLIRRTACELGVLKPSFSIKAAHIHQLSNTIFSKNSCANALGNFFENYPNGRHTTYQNPKMLYRYYYPRYLSRNST